MATRTVTGVFRKLDGTPAVRARVTVTLVGGASDPEAQYMETSSTKETDENGAVSFDLYVNSASDTQSTYRVIAGREEFSFVLPAGVNPLSWAEARSLGITPLNPQYPTLSSYVDAEITERMASGGVFPTDDSGAPIIDAGLLG